MNTLKQEAADVQRTVGLDPASIALVIEAIMAALKAIQECRKYRKTSWNDLRTAERPMQRRRLKSIVRRRIGDYGLDTVKGDALIDELLRRLTARKATELESLYVEATRCEEC